MSYRVAGTTAEGQSAPCGCSATVLKVAGPQVKGP